MAKVVVVVHASADVRSTVVALVREELRRVEVRVPRFGIRLGELFEEIERNPDEELAMVLLGPDFPGIDCGTVETWEQVVDRHGRYLSEDVIVGCLAERRSIALEMQARLKERVRFGQVYHVGRTERMIRAFCGQMASHLELEPVPANPSGGIALLLEPRPAAADGTAVS